VAIARRPSPGSALILGWATGTIFFYGTCYWLTYSMINYGGLPTVLAYLLLIPGAIVIGIFPGFFAFFVALTVRRWGHRALLLAPVFWAALEWARLGITGQLWNAIGYSQAFNPLLIQAASWGGVYAVGFLIVSINAVIALLVARRIMTGFIATFLIPVSIVIIINASGWRNFGVKSLGDPLTVVALQPNVPMSYKSDDETKALLEQHFTLSKNAVQTLSSPRLVVWPESPMNFTYGSDKSFQELIATFTREYDTSLIFNSLEPAPGGGAYNSALLINEEGRLISQYDKIRLMPFGEYVPLPQWLPGASLISGIVGDFTPGDKYALMPVGDRQLGTFICIESAYPWVARNLVREGADGLINISNDGYLGPTAVMRQHLANAIFRAVENGTPVLRVTNTGLSASITSDGLVLDQTQGFRSDVRIFTLDRSKTGSTFYTRYGDLFVQVCAAMTLIILVMTLLQKRKAATDFRGSESVIQP
jgi:apolipoprotein N-acyltransferase